MEKNEFILKVVELQAILDNPDVDTTYDGNRDWVKELMDEDGYRISITAWEPNEGFMIDQHITGFYPELIDIGLEELQEGDMYYSGRLGILELTNLLTRMGFNVSTDTPTQFIGVSSENTETPQPSVSDLETQMSQAVSREDYEEAARLRDVIRDIVRDI